MDYLSTFALIGGLYLLAAISLKVAGAAYAPIWVYVGCVLIVTALSAAWHFGLAIVFGSRRAQAAFGRIRRGLAAVCGAALVGLGLRLGLAHDG